MTAASGVDQLELEYLPGLRPAVAAELAEPTIAARVDARPRSVRDGAVRIRWRGGAGPVLALRTVVAAWAVEHVAVPRPRGLLGDQHLRRLGARVAAVVAGRGPGEFSGLRLAAAGADSAVLRRLAAELAAAVELPVDDADGDLVVRVVPAVGGGWDVLVRLTPRPLATRPWRVVDFPAALNGTIAAAIVRLTRPVPGERAVNLGCGSGTLLVEHALVAPDVPVVGIDLDADVALPAATANTAAAGCAERVGLVRADAARSPLRADAADVLYADLPYGHRSGSHTNNDVLYPAVLREAWRIARPGARFAVITHDISRFEASVASAAATAPWAVEEVARVFQKGHHPRIWLLQRPR